MGRRLSRRNVLRGAAGLTLALPYLESLAQTATPPRRVVFVFTANGDHTSRRMRTKHETSFVFDDMLMPFEAWRRNIIVLDGINKYHERLPSGQRADNHQQGGSALAPWPSGTGSFPIGGTDRYIGYVMGPSADRAIGERVQRQDPNVPYRHLAYRVGGRDNNIWNQHAHAGPVGTQAPIPPEVSPFTAYTRIFGNLSPQQDLALKRRLVMRQSSLDLVRSELNSLKPKLSSSDRHRLDMHTESILEVERGLNALRKEVPQCQPLTLGSSFDVYSDANYQQAGFLFFKMIAMAFACDLTRAVQFNWSGNTSGRAYPSIGVNTSHHDLSHNSDETSYAQIRTVKRHLFDLSCQLHGELSALPEGAGTVFDNTLVVHWSELSQGDTHAINNDLVVLAAGENQGTLRLGRYLNMLPLAKRSFSDVLVSCFHWMGFTDVQYFGYEALHSAGGGPLPNLS